MQHKHSQSAFFTYQYSQNISIKLYQMPQTLKLKNLETFSEAQDQVQAYIQEQYPFKKEESKNDEQSTQSQRIMATESEKRDPKQKQKDYLQYLTHFEQTLGEHLPMNTNLHDNPQRTIVDIIEILDLGAKKYIKVIEQMQNQRVTEMYQITQLKRIFDEYQIQLLGRHLPNEMAQKIKLWFKQI